MSTVKHEEFKIGDRVIVQTKFFDGLVGSIVELRPYGWVVRADRGMTIVCDEVDMNLIDEKKARNGNPTKTEIAILRDRLQILDLLGDCAVFPGCWKLGDDELWEEFGWAMEIEFPI